MNFKLAGILLVLCQPVISSCGSDAQAQNESDDQLSDCLGFDASDINIFVRDSLNDNALLENAVVKVTSQDPSKSCPKMPYIQSLMTNFQIV